MANNDPNSRPNEGRLTSPYTAPNGPQETRDAGRTTTQPVTSGRETGRTGQEETAGEKIGRFFRKAMDRISGHDDDAWRRADRSPNDREIERRYREGARSWQSGHTRGGKAWSDLGSRDDRNASFRSGPSSDTGGGYERLSASDGQGTTGRPYGQGQGYGQGGYGPGPVARGGQGGQEQSWRTGSEWQGESGQTLGQQGLGRSRGESGAFGEASERGLGERGFEGERDSSRDWRRDWRVSSGYGYAGSGAGFGFGRDEERAGDWRDRGDRRFWQREPLAARDVMTRSPKTVNRQSALREAAVIMRDENCGVVPVVDSAGRLEGILTDRDIVVRGLTQDSLQQRIESVMTDDVSAVTEDEPLTSVLDLMGRKQVRRVPVVDREDRLLGIISMADIANRADYDEDLQDAFERISSRRSFWSLFS